MKIIELQKGKKMDTKIFLISKVIADAPLRELRLALSLKVEEMISLALSGDSSIELYNGEEDEGGDIPFTVYPVGEPNTAITGVYYINADGDVCVRKIEF